MDNIKDQETGLLIYTNKDKNSTFPNGDGESGRVSNALLRAISSKKEPNISKNMKAREKEEFDRIFGERKFKLVDLDCDEFKVIYALNFALSKENGAEDFEAAKARVKNYKYPNFARYVYLNALTKLIYNRTDKPLRGRVFNALISLSKKTQCLFLGDDPKEVTPIYGTLIQINSMEDIVLKKVDGTKISVSDFDAFFKKATLEEKAEAIEGVKVGFGFLFFLDYDCNWSYAPAELLPELNKNKIHLLIDLFCAINPRHHLCKIKADKAEASLKKALKDGIMTKENFDEEVEKSKRESFTFTLNFSTIADMVKRDYTSTPRHKEGFWSDLEKTANSLKNVKLITGYQRKKGAKGQDKVEFYLNPDYRSGESKENNKREPILNEKTGEKILRF